MWNNTQQRPGDESPRRGSLDASLAGVPTPRKHLLERDGFLLKDYLILYENTQKIPQNLEKYKKNSWKIRKNGKIGILISKKFLEIL